MSDSLALQDELGQHTWHGTSHPHETSSHVKIAAAWLSRCSC